MAKKVIDCPECGTKSTVSSQSTSPIQCCPFCGNTLLSDSHDEDDDDFDEDDGDGLNEFDPDDE